MGALIQMADETYLPFSDRIELALVLLTARSKSYFASGGDCHAPIPETLIRGVVKAWTLPFDDPEDFRDHLVYAWNAQQATPWKRL